MMRRMTALTPGRRAAVRAALTRRGELGLTQAELAKRAGVHRRTIQDFEAGKKWPRTQTLAQLERLGLDWPVGYLSEFAAKHSEQHPPDVDEDITAILESNLHPDLKLRLIDRLLEIRSDDRQQDDQGMRPERGVG